MKDFSQFFLMNTEDARRYAVEALHFFPSADGLTAEEIGDGNINYVFRVRSGEGPGSRSLIIKQADSRIRTSGNPLDIGRNRIEAGILQLEGELAPGFVPEVYRYDDVMAAISMEDVSAFGNLRKELMAGRVYGHLAGDLSTFVAETLLPTTDLVLDAAEKKRRVSLYTNPQLCRITEDLVLTEPYYDYKGRNILTPGNEDFVQKELYGNGALHAEVGVLREAFMNHAQALLHGDLHTGSVFANETGIRVLDPEFAFYGPMGYDIGNVIGNLFFALAWQRYAAQESGGTVPRLERTIREFFDLTSEKLRAKYDAVVTFPFYREPGFRERYLASVLSDSCGYAGTEIIRRVVGDSKVAEVSSVSDPAVRIPMERALIRLGIRLIMQREHFRKGAELTELFDTCCSVSG